MPSSPIAVLLPHAPVTSTEPAAVPAAVTVAEQPGLRLMTNLVGCAPDEVRIGLEVRAVFERHEDVYVPVFEPVRAP